MMDLVEDLCKRLKKINIIDDCFENLKQNNYISQLKCGFEKYNINFEKLSNFLITNNAIISGSFILQILQNEYYPDSDIDIYTWSEKSKKIEEELYEIIHNSSLKVLCNIKDSNYSKNVLVKQKDIFSYTCNCDDCENKDICVPCVINNGDNRDYQHVIYRRDINKLNYNGIETVIKSEIKFYESDFIKEIVDFTTFKNCKKYQLIYCDKEIYPNFITMIDNFDFDFCANYFDGKKLYVKDWQSIKKKTSVRKFDRYRIYQNELKRIIKYKNRGFNIDIQIFGQLYTLVYVLTNTEYNLPQVENLILYVDVKESGIDDYTETFLNIPNTVKKLIVYNYPRKTLIDNLPMLCEFRIFDWSQYHSIDLLQKKLCEATQKNQQLTIKSILSDIKDINKWLEKNKKYLISLLKKNIKKFPVGCKLYLNDEEIYL